MGNELIVHGERMTENEEKKRSETWSPLAFSLVNVSPSPCTERLEQVIKYHWLIYKLSITFGCILPTYSE